MLARTAGVGHRTAKAYLEGRSVRRGSRRLLDEAMGVLGLQAVPQQVANVGGEAELGEGADRKITGV
jgi:hypothetical protein